MLRELKKFKTEAEIDPLQSELVTNTKNFIENLISNKYDDTLLSNEKFIENPEEKIELPILNVELDKTIGDFKNAIKIYKALESIDLDEANDPRLWIYLSLKVYPAYINKRHAPKNYNQINKQYFFGTGSATSNVSNAISKLWWGVNQTVLDNEKDERKKFLYTKMYFKYTDIVQAIGERKDIFKNKLLVRAILDVVYKKPVKAAPATRILAKYILNHIKSSNIDFMSYKELVSLVEDFYNFSTRFLKENKSNIVLENQIIEEIEF